MEQPRTHQLAARIKTGLFAAMAASAAWTLYQAYLDLEDLGLLQQGADAELWSDLSLEGFWFLMAARVATVLLLLAFARWLAPLPWGRDVTRSETGWADTDPMAYWVGEASAAPTLTESPTMVKVLAIAAPIGLLLAATMVSSVVLETLGSMSHESVWLIVVLPMLGLACFLWHAWLQASSRRLRYDDAGLTDLRWRR